MSPAFCKAIGLRSALGTGQGTGELGTGELSLPPRSAPNGSSQPALQRGTVRTDPAPHKGMRAWVLSLSHGERLSAPPLLLE